MCLLIFGKVPYSVFLPLSSIIEYLSPIRLAKKFGDNGSKVSFSKFSNIVSSSVPFGL